MAVALPAPARSLAFAPDTRSLTAVSRTGLVQHWDLATGRRTDTRREDFLPLLCCHFQ